MESTPASRTWIGAWEIPSCELRTDSRTCEFERKKVGVRALGAGLET